jgi:nucleotide-binding universal stress UspA family protein
VFRDPAPFEAQARLVLDHSVAALVGDDAPIDLRPVLIEEYATKALLGASDGSLLLVVGSRGRGGFEGLLLGSVSQHCISHASCPVVVVPPFWAGATHRRIVVGVDGSPASSGALDWALAEAILFSARLDLVNACDAAALHGPIVSDVPAGGDDDRLVAAAHTLLEKMVADALMRHSDQRRSPPEIELLPSPLGAAASLLTRAAGADLLVVGSRGRGPVRQILLGSVTQQCVHHAPCPIVVVRSS